MKTILRTQVIALAVAIILSIAAENNYVKVPEVAIQAILVFAGGTSILGAARNIGAAIVVNGMPNVPTNTTADANELTPSSVVAHRVENDQLRQMRHYRSLVGEPDEITRN